MAADLMIATTLMEVLWKSFTEICVQGPTDLLEDWSSWNS